MRAYITAEQAKAFEKDGLYVIGRNAKIEGALELEDPVFLHDCRITGPVRIGAHSYVGDFTHVAQHTSIGRYCSIGNSCTIGATRHPTSWLSTHPFQFLSLKEAEVAILPWSWPETRIGNDVWIGSNVVVVGGVTVGDGAVLGAGAVATKDIPHYAIAVGNPARVLRYRFPGEIVMELLAVKWWDLSPAMWKDLPFDDIGACVQRLKEMRLEIDAAKV